MADAPGVDECLCGSEGELFLDDGETPHSVETGSYTLVKLSSAIIEGGREGNATALVLVCVCARVCVCVCVCVCEVSPVRRHASRECVREMEGVDGCEEPSSSF